MGYKSGNIRKKHIIENSCGDGAFLVRIVSRYCTELKNEKNATIKKELESYIHGIELDSDECEKCVENLNKLVRKIGIGNVKWDIKCGNALDIHDYDGKMNFVVGNPPYVRVHNLDDKTKVKQGLFSKSGMTDLFIAFFGIGISMLRKEDGILGYITPSSYFNSLAGKDMRKYLVDNKILKSVVNLGHFQAFNATTYTAITILKNNSKTVDYYSFDEKELKPKFEAELETEDFYINGYYYFGSKSSLNKIKEIFNPIILKQKHAVVKNGFATLADKFFISDSFSFSDNVIPVVKSSTGQKKCCLFPYKNGKIIDYTSLTSNKEILNYYKASEDDLKNRSLENKEGWYGFGRSQAINDVYVDKWAINSLLRTKEDIKLTFAPRGTGVYGGLYIVTDLDLKTIKKLLVCDDFVEYVKTLGKYKSGGYYTFSSKELERYLDFRISEARND